MVKHSVAQTSISIGLIRPNQEKYCYPLICLMTGQVKGQVSNAFESYLKTISMAFSLTSYIPDAAHDWNKVCYTVYLGYTTWGVSTLCPCPMGYSKLSIGGADFYCRFIPIFRNKYPELNFVRSFYQRGAVCLGCIPHV